MIINTSNIFKVQHLDFCDEGYYVNNPICSSLEGYKSLYSLSQITCNHVWLFTPPVILQKRVSGTSPKFWGNFSDCSLLSANFLSSVVNVKGAGGSFPFGYLSNKLIKMQISGIKYRRRKSLHSMNYHTLGKLAYLVIVCRA